MPHPTFRYLKKADVTQRYLDLFIYGDLAHANNSTIEDNFRDISSTAFFPCFKQTLIECSECLYRLCMRFGM